LLARASLTYLRKDIVVGRMRDVGEVRWMAVAIECYSYLNEVFDVIVCSRWYGIV
jgi:hypothetical protein